jgi:hypothetical protein
MANYVVLFCLTINMETCIRVATEISAGQFSRSSNFVPYCHVLFNRFVLLFLSVHLFVLSISVKSLTSFQRGGTKDFARPSERHDVDAFRVIYKCKGFQQNKLSSLCHIRRTKYFHSSKEKVKQSSYRPGVAQRVHEAKVPRFHDNGTGWW